MPMAAAIEVGEGVMRVVRVMCPLGVCNVKGSGAMAVARKDAAFLE